VETLRIRQTTEADIPAIAAIYGQEVLHGFATFEEIPPGHDELLRRRAAILDLGLPYLTAEAGGTVAGFAYAGPYRARHAYRYSVENSVYVDPSRRGAGIGKALLAGVISACEGGGWRQMIAVIGDSGNARSIALHSAMGFRRAGVFTAVGYKHGRWVDTVLMQRPLGAGDTAPPAAGQT
jgi:phosphinothricin acetyltransferase